jgi:putative transposase
MFKYHRNSRAIILQATYFKLRFTVSYRDVEELMQIRGVEHSNIQRWVFKFAPAIEKNMHKSNYQVADSFRMVETFIKVGGKNRFLYRAVDKDGSILDFLLTKRIQKISAQKLFNNAIVNNGRLRVANIEKS